MDVLSICYNFSMHQNLKLKSPKGIRKPPKPSEQKPIKQLSPRRHQVDMHLSKLTEEWYWTWATLCSCWSTSFIRAPCTMISSTKSREIWRLTPLSSRARERELLLHDKLHDNSNETTLELPRRKVDPWQALKCIGVPSPDLTSSTIKLSQSIEECDPVSYTETWCRQALNHLFLLIGWWDHTTFKLRLTRAGSLIMTIPRTQPS